MDASAWDHAVRHLGPDTRLLPDVLLMTTSTPHDAERWQARLEAILPRSTCVFVLSEAGRGRLGNWGGTLHAWRMFCQAEPDLARDQTLRFLLVHNAGASRRSWPLPERWGGGRGDIGLPGGHGEVPLAEVVVRTVCPFAASNPGGVVDVFWSSQIVLPNQAPASLPVPTHDLTKIGVAPRPGDAAEGLADLGWLDATPDRTLAAFCPQGTFADPAALDTWRACRVHAAQDLGSARVRTGLLDAMSAAWSADPDRPLDLDPGLLGPHFGHGRSPYPEVSPGLSEATHGVAHLRPGAYWSRLRHISEIRAALQSLPTPQGRRLRAALGLDHPVHNAQLGDVFVRGPEITWDQVAQGTTVGGVRLYASLVRNSNLRAGSTASESVLCSVAGHVNALQTIAIDTAGTTLELADSLVIGAVSPPATTGRLVVSWHANGADHHLRHPLDAGSPDPESAAASAEPPLTLRQWHSRVQAAIGPDGRGALDPMGQDAWARLARAAFEPATAVQATRLALFGSVIPLCDTLHPDARDRSGELMAGLWEAAAHADPAFARRLTTHNVADAAALLARYRRVRGPQPPIATAPREIAVLSRVTAGADLAIVTPLLQRLRRRFPDAAITLYGPRTTVALFETWPDLTVQKVHFGRSSTLAERLASYTQLADLWAESPPDLVVSPDSRIDQLGSLPLVEESGFRLLETTFSGPGVAMTTLVNQWCDAALGTDAHALPRLYLPTAASDWAHGIPLHPDPARRIAVKLDVGGDASKSLGAAFEGALLCQLLAHGHQIVLDTGWTDEERGEAHARLRTLEQAGARITWVSDLADGRHTPGDRPTEVVAFHGTLAGWAALTGRCAHAVSYDSVHAHLAAAELVRPDGSPVPPRRVAVCVPSGVPERFLAAWTPIGSDVQIFQPDGDAIALACAVADHLAAATFDRRTIPPTPVA